MKECRAAALRDPAFSAFWEGLVALKAELARPSTIPDQKRKSPEASAALAITNCLKSSDKLPVPEWVKKAVCDRYPYGRNFSLASARADTRKDPVFGQAWNWMKNSLRKKTDKLIGESLKQILNSNFADL